MQPSPRRGVVAAGLLAGALLVPGSGPAGAVSERATLFERLSGTWSGAGAAGLPGQSAQPLACRVAFTPAGALRVHLLLTCATGGYKVAVEGDLARDGQRVAGNLVETTFGVTGTLSGTVGADRLNAVVSGMGLAAQFSMTMRGDLQSVTLKGLNGLNAGAAVVLRRA